MSLADYYDGEGGDWLKSGWHTVKVVCYETSRISTGSDMVKFELQDATGKKTRAEFFVRGPKGVACQWKLTNFAKALGLTREECAVYEPLQDNSHRVLIGKKCQVQVVGETKDGKTYHRVEDYELLGVDISDNPQPTDPRLQQPHPSESQHVAPAPPTGDDIPF